MHTKRNIVYLFLYVQDLHTTRAFYEQTLGFRVLEEDASSVKYDAGEIILALNRGTDFAIPLLGKHDDTTLIVFHVTDIDAMRAALERRGVRFSGDTERYDIGATASCYDPDGHCITLYEPSKAAMTWPSADIIRTILSADSRGTQIDTGNSPARNDAGPHQPVSELRLGDQKLLYVFLFISDEAKAAEFYQNRLGLRAVESDSAAGVVKYDCGGILLATHLVEREVGTQAHAAELRTPKICSLVVLVNNIDQEIEQMKMQGVAFVSGVRRSEIGGVAQLHDPDGHSFYLYQPSPTAMTWPSGAKIAQLAKY